MTLTGVGLMAVDSSRTRAYLAALKKAGLTPAHAIYLNGGPEKPEPDLPVVSYFDNTVPALELLQDMGVPTKILDTGDVNVPAPNT